jgi:beta-galactosidase
MYKNGSFVKEYKPHNKHFPSMIKSPILIDDYVGKLLETEEKMPPEKARYIAKAVNFVALYGYPNITPMPTKMAQKCLTVYNTTVDQIVNLYAKYVGNLGSQGTVYRFEAIKDGKVVKTVTKTQMNKISLDIQVSHTNLHEDTSYDVSAVRIRAVDENDNLLSYSNEAIKVTAEGPIEIIGPDMFSLRGGMAGFYVKTTGEKGKAKIRISCPRVEDQIIEFEIN